MDNKGNDALQELEMLTMNAKEVQEFILMKILERNQATEYLSKFMDGSTNISAFKRHVPVVTYDKVQPYILRIATGLGEGKAMYLLFVKAETLTNSGTPVRSVLTSYYKSPHFLHRKHDLYNNYTSPNEVILCPDSQQSMYCQLLCGLVERHLVLRIGAVFASAFLRSISFLEQHWCDLVNDIRIGQLNSGITNPACRLAMLNFLASPNPELADQLEAICSCGSWKGILGRLWPNVKYIEAVLTGTMAQYIPMLEFYGGGGIPLVCTMYASSESYFGVNMRPLCSPADVSYTILPNMAYFEFIPLEDGLRMSDQEEVIENDTLVSLVDVKVGCYYELVVTTFSGLYRYRVGDVLQVTGFYNKTPQFKFICRRNVILSIDSDKTNEEDLHNSVTTAKKILENQNYLLLEYTSYTVTSTVPGHYVLFWEIKFAHDESPPPFDARLIESCCSAVEDSLDCVYRRCKAHDKSIGPLEIRLVEAGAFDALMDLLVSHGSSINQYKTPICIESGLALKVLNSRVIACFFSPRDPACSMVW
uniref:Indole-3-acetic acid-amido synthetase GH3.9 n=1 Tax=Leersia perrieri TaxID=77586 RepID=A0A0D9X2S7_9ORYZ